MYMFVLFKQTRQSGEGPDLHRKNIYIDKINILHVKRPSYLEIKGGSQGLLQCIFIVQTSIQLKV